MHGLNKVARCIEPIYINLAITIMMTTIINILRQMCNLETFSKETQGT